MTNIHRQADGTSGNRNISTIRSNPSIANVKTIVQRKPLSRAADRMIPSYKSILSEKKEEYERLNSQIANHKSMRVSSQGYKSKQLGFKSLNPSSLTVSDQANSNFPMHNKFIHESNIRLSEHNPSALDLNTHKDKLFTVSSFSVKSSFSAKSRSKTLKTQGKTNWEISLFILAASNITPIELRLKLSLGIRYIFALYKPINIIKDYYIILEKEHIAISRRLAKYQKDKDIEAQMDKNFEFSDTCTILLNLLNQQDETEFANYSDEESVYARVLLVLLNEEEPQEPCNLNSYIIDTVMKDYNAKSLRGLILRHVDYNLGIGELAILKIRELVDSFPYVISFSESFSYGRVSAVMSLVIREILAYFQKESPDGTSIMTLRMLRTKMIISKNSLARIRQILNQNNTKITE